MTSSLTDLLGDTLLLKEGDVINEIPTGNIAIKNTVIGLLFSAIWCPPCQEFTPKLIEWYKALTGPDGKLNGKLNIVFLSSDKNETEFDSYFSSMPWYALKYSDRSRKTKLSEHFSVTGIPLLIFIEADTGKIITLDGRGIVSDDPTGSSFPWTDPKIDEFKANIISETILDKEGNKFKFGDIIKGKITALFFSAHWCPPCNRFLPRLIETYNSVNSSDPKWEIVFISLDRNEEEYNEHIAGGMPWKRMLLDTKKAKPIARRYFITGIPGLVILDDELNVLNLNARTHVEMDAKGEHFPWKAKRVGEMVSNFDAAYAIAHSSIIYSIEKQEDIADVMGLLQEVSDVFRDRKDMLMNFYYYCPKEGDTGTCEEIYIKAIKTTNTCILFDAKNNKKFLFSDDKKTKKDLVEAIEKHSLGELQLSDFK